MNEPIPMRLPCPKCHELHIDEWEFETKPHHTHACQFCGHVWRPALVFTVGVRFLPGFKNADCQEDWTRILPSQLRVSCSSCGSNTNAPTIHGYSFMDGKWHCGNCRP